MLKNNIVFGILILGIVLLGGRLREYVYDEVPHPGENADEYSFAWLGISLINNGYPVAWSGIPGYKQYDYQRINVDSIFDKYPNKELFPINKPWFDHPPLFGVLIGGYAHWKGVNEFEEASVSIIRLPMLKIALLTSVLILVLGVMMYGRAVGLIAMLLYSVIPTFVISSRMALAENGYLPLWLGVMILSLMYINNKKRRYWYAACFLTSLAILFKLSGVAFALYLIFFAMYFKRGKERRVLVSTCVLSVAVPILLFALYGFYYDWGVFRDVFLSNTSRFYGAGAEMFYSVINRNFVVKSFNDGWIQSGWIAVFLVSFSGWRRTKSGTVITLAVLSCMIVLLLFGNESYERYRFPFYPLMSIATASVVNRLYWKPNLLASTALMLLPIGTSVHKLIGVAGFQNYVSLFRGLVLLFGLMIVFSEIKRERGERFERLLFTIVFVLAVIVSIETIYYYNIDTWYFAS